MRPVSLDTCLDRRQFLAASAALAFVTPVAGRAATAPHRFTAGAFELSIISDGHLVLPTSFLAPDAPAAERASALAEAGHGGAQYDAPTNVTLIRTGRETILVDAGSGPNFMPSAGRLVDNLDAAGIAADTITKVVFTHGHPDHLWGVVDGLDELTFPNASYVVAAAEWDFWRGDDAIRGLPEERVVFVQAARRNYARIRDRVGMVRPGDDIVSGLRVVGTPGHTQGHISLEIAGADGCLITGDALTHPVISFRYPRWHATADHEAERAAATRASLLDRLATDRLRIVGFHLPYPGIGRVERKDSSYRFVVG
jgi:glyoxylase-like metal-dependent hydrolase (beta-lactamase superfamily II)